MAGRLLSGKGVEGGRGDRVSPPQLDVNECKFGRWLKDEGLSKYGVSENYREIDCLHNRIHELTQDIVTLHAHDNRDLVEKRLKELDELKNSLLILMNNLLLD